MVNWPDGALAERAPALARGAAIAVIGGVALGHGLAKRPR